MPPALAGWVARLPAIRFPARPRWRYSTSLNAKNLLARANELGDRFQKRARQWQKRWPIVGDVRGLGGMQAIELVRSADTREPAAEETKQITQYCYEHGLITITAGSYSNVVRVLVPLVVTDQQLDEGLDVLESALQMVCEKRVPSPSRYRLFVSSCVVAGDSPARRTARCPPEHGPACPERSRRAGATISS